MEIKIKKEEKSVDEWNFLVEIGGIEYLVTVDEEYWEKLTNKQYSSRELIKKSFKFLLGRESKESILRRFNLRDINRYFPEYEDEILGYIVK